ncbi:MAG: hypothetical protein V4510_09650 [bacterium]
MPIVNLITTLGLLAINGYAFAESRRRLLRALKAERELDRTTSTIEEAVTALHEERRLHLATRAENARLTAQVRRMSER